MKKEMVFAVVFVLGSIFSTANAGARGTGKICNVLQMMIHPYLFQFFITTGL